MILRILLMIMMLSSLLILSSCDSGPSKKDLVQTVPAFIGGLDEKNIHTCNKIIKKKCPVKDSPMDPSFIDCVEIEMVQQKKCIQSLAFFILKRAFFEKIKHYPSVDGVRASVVAANEPTRYYIVTKSGEFIDLLTVAHHIDIQKDPSYKIITKQYPHAELWGIALDFPTVQKLSEQQTRLIFKQKLLNGCHTCEEAGIADIAYDFNQKGQLMEIVTFQLTPINTQ